MSNARQQCAKKTRRGLREGASPPHWWNGGAGWVAVPKSRDGKEDESSKNEPNRNQVLTRTEPEPENKNYMQEPETNQTYPVNEPNRTRTQLID